MGTPEVTDRLKDVPVRVLRAIFAGIGQLLLVADRIRSQHEGLPAAGPAPDDQPDPLSQPRRRSLDQTNNVRILTPEDAQENPKPEDLSGKGPSAPLPPAPPAPSRPAKQPAATQPATKRTAAKRAARAQPATIPPAAPPPAAPPPAAKRPARARPAAPRPAAEPPAPLPGYDGLSLASLRARLRGLDLAALAAVLSYERAHANRPEVITMFEHRIEKLSGGA